MEPSSLEPMWAAHSSIFSKGTEREKQGEERNLANTTSARQSRSTSTAVDHVDSTYLDI